MADTICQSQANLLRGHDSSAAHLFIMQIRLTPSASASQMSQLGEGVMMAEGIRMATSVKKDVEFQMKLFLDR